MHLKTPIILHRGQSCPLPQPHKASDGHVYPYLFAAVTPVVHHWRYRVLPAIHPSELSESAWKALHTDNGPVLRADWEEIRGHPIGAVTVYLTGPKGNGTQSARIEVEPPMPRLGHPRNPASPQAPVRPKPPAAGPEITPDMF